LLPAAEDANFDKQPDAAHDREERYQHEDRAGLY
jgi:hypothetical protein